MTESEDREEIIARVAALDIGKADLGVLRAASRAAGTPKAAAGSVDAFDE